MRRYRRAIKELNDEQLRYTMLVAWHKFDHYERQQLVKFTKIEINKLPFTQLNVFYHRLIIKAKENDTLLPWVKSGDGFPAIDFYTRIYRAAMKEYKNRKRVRLRIEV